MENIHTYSLEQLEQLAAEASRACADLLQHGTPELAFELSSTWATLTLEIGARTQAGNTEISRQTARRVRASPGPTTPEPASEVQFGVVPTTAKRKWGSDGYAPFAPTTETLDEENVNLLLRQELSNGVRCYCEAPRSLGHTLAPPCPVVSLAMELTQSLLARSRVTTRVELTRLPVGSVVKTSSDELLMREGADRAITFGKPGTRGWMDAPLPVELVHLPAPRIPDAID